jgi:phosphohistidine swiveling domain-containing protein
MYALDGRDGSHNGIGFQDGGVFVTDMTDPHLEPIMKKASAIITDKGGVPVMQQLWLVNSVVLLSLAHATVRICSTMYS